MFTPSSSHIFSSIIYPLLKPLLTWGKRIILFHSKRARWSRFSSNITYKVISEFLFFSLMWPFSVLNKNVFINSSQWIFFLKMNSMAVCGDFLVMLTKGKGWVTRLMIHWRIRQGSQLGSDWRLSAGWGKPGKTWAPPTVNMAKGAGLQWPNVRTYISPKIIYKWPISMWKDAQYN